MIGSKLLEMAETFATNAHRGQTREGGIEPYINHPRRVAEYLAATGLPSDELLAAAWLHDVLEDCLDTTAQMLLDAGFPEAVVDTVVLLTRPPSESYAAYIARIRDRHNMDAIKIKLSDLADNTSDLKPGARRDKYELAKIILEDV